MGSWLGEDGVSDPINILVICTGNRCRSPLVAALLARRTFDAGVEVEIRSGGRDGEGIPVLPQTLAVGEELGVDLANHRSRRWTLPDLLEADLVIGMAREHVREAVLARPEVWPRCFTLKEVVRRGGQKGPRRSYENVADWLFEVHQGRHFEELLDAAEKDDIDDPRDGPLARYRDMAAELDSLTQWLVLLMWPAELRTVS